MGSKEYRSPFPDVGLPEIDLLSFLFSNPFACPASKPIYIDATTGECRTYHEIIHRTKCLVAGLKSIGVKEGDVVAIFSPNTIDYPIYCFSVLGLGAIVSPVSAASTPVELSSQLRTAGAKLLITHSSLYKVASKAVEGTRVQLVQADGKSNNGELTITQLVSASSPGSLFCTPAHEVKTRTALLPFSSGTTGLAKGVTLTHYNLTSNMLQNYALAGDQYTGVSTFIAFLPLSHVYGISCFILLSMWSGSTVVVMPRFDLQLYLSTIEKYKVDVLHVVPPVALLLAKNDSVVFYDLGSVKRLFSAAAPLPIELRIVLEDRFHKLWSSRVHVFQAYGLSETSPLLTQVPFSRTDKKHTVGCVAPNVVLRLIDPHTLQDVAAPGHSGEFWAKGPNVTSGYQGNDAATANSFTEDGWFRTGDIGIVDEDGFFCVVDRIKEMFKYKGLQVIPSELEGKLVQHPLVQDAGVIGVWENEQASELPTAYVVLAPTVQAGKKDAAVREIDRWFQTQVANHKKLRGGIYVVEAVPKSPSGKILRRELIEMTKRSKRVAKL